jgi:acyl carrier protein
VLRDRCLSVVSKVLKVPLSEVDDATSPQTLGTWDSFQHMNLIIALEDEFHVKFTEEEIFEIDSVGAICSIVTRKAPTA